MGTMVGGDGPGPFASDIGVAPGAKWIAAKGCGRIFCSDSALLRSGEWVLAPTDLNGQNPRPDLRPHVVNNSWGGAGGDRWYAQTVNAWLAAGIFPAFSAGNSGPNCSTAGSPGDYPRAFGSGATDRNDRIASFSSRGPSRFGYQEPDAAAPGVDVRSSTPNDSYAALDGTSMASPHTAGTVALLWSRFPALVGDAGATQHVIKRSALGIASSQCGPAGPPNSVYGWGRIDALAAVQKAKELGRVTGVVTSGGAPLKAAVVGTVDDGNPVKAASDSAGSYVLHLLPGTYRLTAHKRGYQDESQIVTVTTGGTSSANFDLSPGD
jgi:subtilisin family serine protease